MSEDNKTIDFFNSAIIISVVTGDIYLSAYEYERGYCGFFNIPDYLIEVSVTNVLAFAGSALLFLMLFMNISGLLMPLVRRVGKMENGSLKATLAINLMILFTALLIFMVYPISTRLWYTIIGLFLGSNLIAWLLLIVISLKDDKPVASSAQIYHETTQKFSSWGFILGFMERRYIIPFIIILVLPWFMWMYGQGTAMKQKEFECITGHKDVLVIRKYNDILICSSVDTVHKSPNRQITLIKINDKDAVGLSKIVIGPLKDNY